MVGVIVDDFVDDHPLKIGLGQHTKGSDFGLNKLTDIRIVSVLLVSMIFIGVRMALGIGCSFYFRHLLVELDFQHGMLERRGGSWEVDIRRGVGVFSVGPYRGSLERIWI